MRAFCPPDGWDPVPADLPEEERRHLVQVQRLRPGDRFEILDGAGRRTEATATAVDRRRLAFRCGPPRTEPGPTTVIDLLPALIREQPMDGLVQKATELGVRAIRPFVAARSVARADARGLAAKADRWRRVAVAAIKQCGNPWLPEIAPVPGLDGLAPAARACDLLLVCTLEGARRPLASLLADHPAARHVGILIGPEGDLDPDEVARAVAWGGRVTDLGPLVLRTDTAALFAVSVVAHDRRSRP